jgi:hypothetical protein
MSLPRRSIVPCIESDEGRRGAVPARRAVAALALCVAACAGPSADRAPGEGDASARRAPATTANANAPARPGALAAAPAGEARRALAAPKSGRNWAEVREQAAERLVAANPEITYMGRVPDQLLAIPVLEVELNGDGSVRRIEILREPREAKDTLKIAVEAIRRAAPFGDVSRLPRPWKFTETFLFDDARKFKPRTLDR